ncbi:uncharacterized protein [Physcomitrium patens]|uniref:uncharacterized protein isoform X2 n=1 Tax=Physcomitrium patens TaxID=3218 RepID=UPI003CCCED17
MENLHPCGHWCTGFHSSSTSRVICPRCKACDLAIVLKQWSESKPRDGWLSLMTVRILGHGE